MRKNGIEGKAKLIEPRQVALSCGLTVTITPFSGDALWRELPWIIQEPAVPQRKLYNDGKPVLDKLGKPVMVDFPGQPEYVAAHRRYLWRMSLYSHYRTLSTDPELEIENTPDKFKVAVPPDQSKLPTGESLRRASQWLDAFEKELVSLGLTVEDVNALSGNATISADALQEAGDENFQGEKSEPQETEIFDTGSLEAVNS